VSRGQKIFAMPEISVIIPTFNRARVLYNTLKGYERQSVKKDVFEVIVIDDGSTDETAAVLEEAVRHSPYKIRTHFQQNQGPGQARNWAIAESRSPLVLITGDDIIPHEDLLWGHLLRHSQSPADTKAVLGKVEWDPGTPVSFFMHFITEVTNYQFGFHQIKNTESASYRFFYTSNISLKTAFLRRQSGFHPAFIHAAYEDIELGYRLEKCGLEIAYQPKAVGYHRHPVTLSSFCDRQYKAGQMSVVMARLHPEFGAQDKPFGSLEELQSFREQVVRQLVALNAMAKPLGLESAAGLEWNVVPEELKAGLFRFLAARLNLQHELGRLDWLKRVENIGAVN
jgi:glycosyltransferase involved in cell wall biosynthesis